MTEFCTNDGASKLALKIREYWQKQGFDVSVETRKEGFVATMRSSRTDIRSDMVNGMPRRSSPQEGAAAASR